MPAIDPFIPHKKEDNTHTPQGQAFQEFASLELETE